MWMFFNVSVIITFAVCLVDTAKILAVFPVPSISHQVVFRPITQELARRGHDVTVITPNPAFKKGRTPPRLIEIDVHDVSYTLWLRQFTTASKGNKVDIFNQMEIVYEILSSLLDAILINEEIQIMLNDETKMFDLLLLEACVRPALGFSYIFKSPTVLISSFGAFPGHYELMGSTEHPFLYPNILHQKLYNLTMWQKVNELYSHIKHKHIIEKNSFLDNEVLRKHFGYAVPSVKELENNVDLLLLNTNPIFTDSHPVPQNIIYIGGIHLNPENPLPVVSI